MIVGKIYFLLVRIKIKHMEIAIIKRETTGSGKFLLFLNFSRAEIFIFFRRRPSRFHGKRDNSKV